MPLKDRLVLLVAEGFGTGRIPIAPGTFGSSIGIALGACLKTCDAGPATCLVIWAVMLAVGIPICTQAATIRNQHDPGSIVWDEITAFPLVYAIAGLSTFSLVVGFVLFRIFDIAKPWPVRRLEGLPAGLGIMADDQAAAVWAGILTSLLLRAAVH
jgi:phosphatidylglycerophosphatase A